MTSSQLKACSKGLFLYRPLLGYWPGSVIIDSSFLKFWDSDRLCNLHSQVSNEVGSWLFTIIRTDAQTHPPTARTRASSKDTTNCRTSQILELPQWNLPPIILFFISVPVTRHPAVQPRWEGGHWFSTSTAFEMTWKSKVSCNCPVLEGKLRWQGKSCIMIHKKESPTE